MHIMADRHDSDSQRGFGYRWMEIRNNLKNTRIKILTKS